MTVYKSLHSGGDECTRRRAIVRLYPDSSYVDQYYTNEQDDIPVALENAFGKLLSADAVSYYDIQVIDTSQVDYPKVRPSSISEAQDEFESYLTTGWKNGTGQNLKNRIGAHMLVHSEGCNTDVAGGEAADYCPDRPSAFKQGVMAWTGAACSGFDGLQRNSAIQEAVHQFVRFGQILGSSLVDGAETKYFEHRLGEVRDWKVTPMLTYHANESDQYGEGTCDGDGTQMDGYDQRLTDCTIEAVRQVSNNQCNGQQPKPDNC